MNNAMHQSYCIPEKLNLNIFKQFPTSKTDITTNKFSTFYRNININSKNV